MSPSRAGRPSLTPTARSSLSASTPTALTAITQSQRLAEIIQDELNSLLGTKDRGIKQAPFKVLTGVACPAVLVESAFISNPQEERDLVREGFQGDVAQAIYRGPVRYIKLLS